MIYSIKPFSRPYTISTVTVLYLFAVASLVVLTYSLPTVMQIEMDTWASYYRGLGLILNVWGYVIGGCMMLYWVLRTLRFVFGISTDSMVIRFSVMDGVFGLLVIHNLVTAVIGAVVGNPVGLIAADTYKGIIISLLYFWTKQSLKTDTVIRSTVTIIIFIETILFILFYFTDYLPLSIASRTFLYTITFTLFFEEERVPKKFLYLCLVCLSLFIVITSAAYRGTIIVFFIIVGLNFFLKVKKESALRETLFIGAGGLLVLLVSLFISFTSIEKSVDVVTSRFESTTGGSHRKFGLEESAFQRVGETLDVIRSFQESNPAFILVGFGNGALLNNTLITPSERSVYKTQYKHNIYITLLAIVFRQGLIGLTLYSALFGYVFWMVKKFRQYMRHLAPKREYVYLKMLLLYHVSVIIYSFVAYIYIGNLFIGISFGIMAVLFERMRIDFRSATVSDHMATVK
jgi:hypothetical protein